MVSPAGEFSIDQQMQHLADNAKNEPAEFTIQHHTMEHGAATRSIQPCQALTQKHTPHKHGDQMGAGCKLTTPAIPTGALPAA